MVADLYQNAAQRNPFDNPFFNIELLGFAPSRRTTNPYGDSIDPSLDAIEGQKTPGTVLQLPSSIGQPTPNLAIQQIYSLSVYSKSSVSTDPERCQPKPTRDPNAEISIEKHGIKGQSVYTTFFNHLDMETFTCKISHHLVKGYLEDAITHQRIARFGHYPFQCLPSHWYAPFSFPWVRIKNTFSIQRTAICHSINVTGTPAQ